MSVYLISFYQGFQQFQFQVYILKLKFGQHLKVKFAHIVESLIMSGYGWRKANVPLIEIHLPLFDKIILDD